jgi:hypothetical protein
MSHLLSEDQPFGLAYTQSQHQEVICATAGSSLLWLKQQFQRFHPECVSRVGGLHELIQEDLSLEVIKEFALEDFFEPAASGELVVKISALPEYLRIRDADGGLPLETSLKLSKHGLLGLRKLIEKGGSTELFKNFAMGLLVQDDRFDAFICRGQKYSMPLGEVFTYVVFALSAMEAGVDLSKTEIHGFAEIPKSGVAASKSRVSGVFGIFYPAQTATASKELVSGSSERFLGWNVLYEQLMRGSFFLCPTARRHELVAVLGEVACPNIYVFHHPLKFLEQCVDEFLAQKSQAFYEKNPAGYLQWMARFYHQENMTGALGDFLREGLLISSGEPLAGAGSAGLPSDFEKKEDERLATLVDSLRKFLFERLRSVGLIRQSTLLMASPGESYAMGEMLLKAISDRLSVEDLETSHAYLESRPVPKLLEKNISLALQRIQYLEEKYKDSAPARWIAAKLVSQSEDLLHLGNLADQFSEELEILETIQKYKFPGPESELVAREISRLSFLKETGLSGFESKMMHPVEYAQALSDRIRIKALIKEKTSGLAVFAAGFFAAWKAAGESENFSYKEEARNALIGEFLSRGEFLASDFIENYVRTHTTYEVGEAGITPILDLDVQTINLILLQALQRPFEERIADAWCLHSGEGEVSPFFRAVIQVIDFIKHGFSGMDNEKALKRDSYPDSLLALILAGGGIAEFVFEYEINSVNFSRKMGNFRRNRWEILENFPLSPAGVLWGIIHIEPDLGSNTYADFLKDALKRDHFHLTGLKAMLFQPWIMLKILNGESFALVLSHLLRFKKAEGFVERLRDYLKAGLRLSEIQDGTHVREICEILQAKGDSEISLSFFESFITQRDFDVHVTDLSVFLEIVELSLNYPSLYESALSFAVKFLEKEDVLKKFQPILECAEFDRALAIQESLKFLARLINHLRLLGASPEFLESLDRRVKESYAVVPDENASGSLATAFRGGAGAGAGAPAGSSSTTPGRDFS